MRQATVFIVLLVLAAFSGCNQVIMQAPDCDVPEHVRGYLYESAHKRVCGRYYLDPVLNTVWFNSNLIEVDPEIYRVKLTFAPIDSCEFTKLANNQYQIILTYWVNELEDIYTLSIRWELGGQPMPLIEDLY